MNIERSSGLLLHITCLPSPYGIGDLGKAAYEFVDFMEAAAQRYWQILPLTPTQVETANSPYSSPSAFAGNVLLVSPDKLVEDGYLTPRDCKPAPGFNNDRVNFDHVIPFKKRLLNKAYENFKKHKKLPADYNAFRRANKYWLDDYALFVALKEAHAHKAWSAWPAEVRDRHPKALKEAASELSEAVIREKFFQYLFFSQWQKLAAYSKKKKINFIGDIPYYVNHDSADCWSHAGNFKLDVNRRPVKISGVPPDYFSETGQLWGTPVYDWNALEKKGFSWWIERVRQNLRLFDLVRFDHFRAFSAYWEVPAGEETAVNGKWTKCPGISFFKAIKEVFPEMPFIAEDLGLLDPPVHRLRDRFDLPGMRVLQFAFGEGMAEGTYIPHHHIENCIVYTGTHDNNTTKGWFKHSPLADKKRIAEYVGRRINIQNVTENLQRLALMSVASLAILPVQDILNLGEAAIMNRPGTSDGNWTWRLPPGQLTDMLAKKLRYLCSLYDR